MIISFSGTPGSGKSTTAQMLADKLAWPRYYMGSIWREMARKEGIDVTTYSKLNENNPDNDRKVDEYQRELGEKEDNFVIEGRTSWYFIPHSLKIYLYVDPEEGAKRIFGSLQKKNNRNEGTGLSSWQEIMANNRSRLESDNKRYYQNYGVDVSDLKNYDLYLDTTSLTPDAVFPSVYEFVKTNLDKRKI